MAAEILKPPRITGNAETDIVGVVNYLGSLYNALVTERQFLRTEEASRFATPDDLTGLATTDDLTALGLGSAAVLAGAGSTYTPVAANDVNLDSLPTMFAAQYIRLGDVVTVSGRFTSDATAGATSTSFTMTLPVASDFTALADCAGVAASPTSAGACAAIYADTTNNVAKVQWVSGSTASQDHFFQFTYQIK